jgi:hypothetical protein
MAKCLAMGVMDSQLRVRSERNVSAASFQRILSTILGAYEWIHERKKHKTLDILSYNLQGISWPRLIRVTDPGKGLMRLFVLVRRFNDWPV